MKWGNSDGAKKGKVAYTQQQAKVKVSRYCAYQERSQHEVRQKLADMGFWGDEAEEIIADLIETDFVNEERFARAFAGGKFRVKKWGRQKITQALKAHKVSAYCLKAALSEIKEEDYWNTLVEQTKKRWAKEKGPQEYVRKQKTVRYLITRGYEQDLAWEALLQVMEEQNE